MQCGCGYKNGAWKYDMQHMTFSDKDVKEGPVVVQPNPKK